MGNNTYGISNSDFLKLADLQGIVDKNLFEPYQIYSESSWKSIIIFINMFFIFK